MTKKKNLLVIINPVSGISNKQKIRELIDDNIDKEKFDPELVFTAYAGHGKLLATEAVNQGYNAVVVVGGDGSVNEVGAALVNTEVPLGIIPTGSGNGLAHHLKLPFNLNKAIGLINKFHFEKIDTYTVNGQFGCNVAGVGFDAHVAEKFALVSRRGFWSYFRIILQEYPGYEAMPFTLEYGAEKIHRKALLISFANSNQFGNGAVIAPEASLTDGLLDICIMSKVPLLEAPLMGQMLIFKLINRTHYVEYIKTAEFTLTQEIDGPSHIDGDPFVRGKKFHVKVNPLSLNVITP